MSRTAICVMQETETTGTGVLSLGPLVGSNRTLATAISDDDLLAGDSVPYKIEGINDDGSTTGQWEVGTGTVGIGGSTLTRDTVLVSSNSNTLVNFVSGTKYVWLWDGQDEDTKTLGYSGENKDTASIPPGSPVAIHSSGTGVRLAEAGASGAECVGLSLRSTAVGFSTDVRTEGLFQLDDWSTVTEEGDTLLAARATYFLSLIAGKITTTPPATVSQRVQVVGRAVSTDTLDLAIGESLLL